MLSAIGSFASSLLGARISSQNAQKVNEQNERNLERQNAFNLAMWKRQNEYNLPKNQVERLKDAGINPALALSNISTGMAESMPSVAPQGAVGHNAGDIVANSFGGAIDAYVQGQQAKNLRAQEALTKAEVAKTLSENKHIDSRAKAEVDKAVSETAKNLAQTDTEKFNLSYLKSASPDMLRSLQEDINYKIAQTDVARTVQSLNLDVLKSVRPLERQKLQAEIGNIIQNTHYLVLNGRVAVEQANSLIQSVAESKIRAMGIDINNKQVQAMFAPTLRNLNAQTQMYGSQARNTDKRTDYMGQENARGWISTVGGFARDIGIAVGSVGDVAKSAFAKPLSPIGFRQ